MHTVKLRPLDKWLLALLLVALSASTIAWTLADKTPPAWDPADHITAAYDYYYPIARLEFGAFKQEFYEATHYYAPLVHLVTAGVFLILGASRVTGIAVNLIALAVLLLSVSWIARTVYSTTENGGNTTTRGSLALGVLAPLLATSYHFSAWLLHDAFLDYPLIAIVAFSTAMLIRAGDFKGRGPALLFGLSLGLGMLTKQTFAFFLFLPTLYVAIKVLLSRDWKAILNLALAAMLGIAVAGIWYFPHLNDVIEIYQVNKQAATTENEAPLFGYRSNLFYPHALLSTQMQLPLGLLFLTGLVYSLVRRRRESLILYLLLIGGIGSFVLVANKDPRYTVPVLSIAAVISVCWLVKREPDPKVVQHSWIRKAGTLKPALAAAAAVWALASFYNAQWPREGMGYYIDTPEFRWMVFARNYFTLDHRPGNDDWSVPAIVQTIAGSLSNSSQEQQGTVIPQTIGLSRQQDASVRTVGVVVNLPYLNPSSIALYARLLAPGRAAPPMFKVDWLVVDSAADRMLQCDFLVVRTGLDRAEWVAPLERPAEKLIQDHPERFTRIAAFQIPVEGAEAVIYKREDEPNRR